MPTKRERQAIKVAEVKRLLEEDSDRRDRRNVTFDVQIVRDGLTRIVIRAKLESGVDGGRGGLT